MVKNTPLRIYDYSVTKDWNIEKVVEYQRNIHNTITYMDKIGKPFSIEYIDKDLNVVSTVRYKGDKKKFLKQEATIEKMAKGELPE